MSSITQRGATGPLGITANGTFQSSTDANNLTLVGTRWDLSDGRELVLVSTSSATTTTPGFLYQEPALIANHQGLTVTGFTPYGTTGGVANSSSTPATVTVTLGATALTVNQYQGGFLIVQSGPGIGQTLRIAENPVALSSATGVVITLEDGPNVALTTSSVVSLYPAVGANVIVSPTTPTNVSAGISLYPIAASSYGFLVAKGIVGAVFDATVATAGQSISPSVTTAGTVTLATASGTALTKEILGATTITSTSAAAYPVFINI